MGNNGTAVTEWSGKVSLRRSRVKGQNLKERRESAPNKGRARQGPKDRPCLAHCGAGKEVVGRCGGGRSVGPRKPLEGFGFTWDEMGGRWKVR